MAGPGIETSSISGQSGTTVTTTSSTQASATGNGAGVDWRTSLSEEMRNNSSLQDFPTVEALAKSFIDTQAHVGNSLRIPSSDASQEARAEFVQKVRERVPELMLKPDFENAEQSAEFFRMLGAPEHASQYNLPSVENLEIPQERANLLKEIAHKAGLTAKQFEQVTSAVLGADAELMQSASQAREAGMVKLKQEWGLAFDERMQTAKSAAEATQAPQELRQALADGQVGAETVKWLYRINEQLGRETVQLTGGRENTGNVLSPVEANAQVDEIMGNKKHPYWDASHPSHAVAVEKVLKLMEMATGESRNST